ncbi:hypothetical protein J6590_087660 [Homalodisca vitripennis]|nr:hypothetical protein J6590_087660 [Homalodisca vitripennis]
MTLYRLINTLNYIYPTHHLVAPPCPCNIYFLSGPSLSIASPKKNRQPSVREQAVPPRCVGGCPVHWAIMSLAALFNLLYVRHNDVSRHDLRGREAKHRLPQQRIHECVINECFLPAGPQPLVCDADSLLHTSVDVDDYMRIY